MDTSRRTKFASKHPEGVKADPTVIAALKAVVKDDRVPCAVAHAVAGRLGIDPSAVGMTIDLMEWRISKCQLGLFGYSPEKKIVKGESNPDPRLRQMLEQHARDRRIACDAVWHIADQLNIPRMAAGAACEGLALKIAHCQLGAF